MKIAKALYNDTRDYERGNSNKLTPDSKSVIEAETQLSKLATVARIESLSNAVLWSKAIQILSESKVGLQTYPPYQRYTEAVNELGRRYEVAINDLCSVEREINVKEVELTAPDKKRICEQATKKIKGNSRWSEDGWLLELKAIKECKIRKHTAKDSCWINATVDFRILYSHSGGKQKESIQEFPLDLEYELIECIEAKKAEDKLPVFDGICQRDMPGDPDCE